MALPRPAVSFKRCFGGWVPGFFAIPLFGLAAETELLGAAVGDTAWVTIPGELQTSFGLAIKRELRGVSPPRSPRSCRVSCRSAAGA